MGDIDVRTTATGPRYDVRFRDPTGRQRSKSFRTKKEAERFAATVAAGIWAGQWVDPAAGRITLAEYSADWMAGRPLRPRTRELYESNLRLHILPALGTYQLSRIKPGDVRAWHGTLVRRSGAGSLVPAKCYRLLRAILSTATDDELIARNPCGLKGAGAERSQERPIASPAQVWELADAMDDRYRALILLAGFVGLRLGELLGLQRRDVDLGRATLRIERQLQELEDASFALTAPKSDAGQRTLALPAPLVEELEQHLQAWVGHEADAWVFTGLKGGPLRRNVWYRRWGQALTASSVPAGFHFHDLRHTANTIAAATPGVSTKDLMYRMGHASGRAALLYQHATSRQDALIAATIGSVARRPRHSTVESDSPG